MTVLVRVRCGHCRRVLREVTSRPPSWDAPDVKFLRCRRCDLPSPGRIVGVMIQKRLNGFPLLGLLPWAELRAAIEQAERRGRPVDYPITARDTAAP